MYRQIGLNQRLGDRCDNKNVHLRADFLHTATASVRTNGVEVGVTLEKRKSAAVNRALYSSRFRSLPPSMTSIFMSIMGAKPGVPISSIKLSTTRMRPDLG